MAEWIYNPDRWAETREVTIAQDGDSMWRWRRVRTGPEGREVSQSVSGGFDDPKWAYRNAVKENYPLTVPVPEGVEEMTVTEAPDIEPESPDDPPETPEVPPQPEA